MTTYATSYAADLDMQLALKLEGSKKQQEWASSIVFGTGLYLERLVSETIRKAALAVETGKASQDKADAEVETAKAMAAQVAAKLAGMTDAGWWIENRTDDRWTEYPNGINANGKVTNVQRLSNAVIVALAK